MTLSEWVRPLSRCVFDNSTAQQELPLETLCMLVLTFFSIRQTHGAFSIGGRNRDGEISAETLSRLFSCCLSKS